MQPSRSKSLSDSTTLDAASSRLRDSRESGGTGDNEEAAAAAAAAAIAPVEACGDAAVGTTPPDTASVGSWFMTSAYTAASRERRNTGTICERTCMATYAYTLSNRRLGREPVGPAVAMASRTLAHTTLMGCDGAK